MLLGLTNSIGNMVVRPLTSTKSLGSVQLEYNIHRLICLLRVTCSLAEKFLLFFVDVVVCCFSKVAVLT